MRPSALANASPALVRSRSIARSNSAKLPTICIVMRPAGVVVSIASVSDWNPAPAASIRSIRCSKSFSDLVSRSSFHTTTVSAGRSWRNISWRTGLSHRPPDAASWNTRWQPAAASDRACAAFDCSSPLETRAYVWSDSVALDAEGFMPFRQAVQ